MASCAPVSSPTTEIPSHEIPRRDHLLRWIAAERMFRAVVLLIVGVVLVTHSHANWSADITKLAHSLGLDPTRNGIHRIIDKVKGISPHRYVFFGIVALAYGALEGTEAYGLWRRRPWGEYLTVVATSVLLIPETWELTKSVTALKIGGLLVNIAVVAYLVARLRRGGP
jgi:uncharacterized membrane protein (DUF2068 family)